MPRIHFHQQLADLKERLLAMAALAQQAVESSVEAYLQRDAALCEYVRQNENAINAAQREVDELAYDLLAKEQPMAIDLRFILAVIKINADIERVGDSAQSISDRVRSLIELPIAEMPVDIPRMASLAEAMVRRALQAFIEADASIAESVLSMDDTVDRLNQAAYSTLLNVMKTQPDVAPQALSALVISRTLERVADHATNIAEDVIFWVRGADVRHHKLVTESHQP